MNWRPEPEPRRGNLVPEVRSCNRHHNCDHANEQARRNAARVGREEFGAQHCHDDECEDCFGS